MTYNQPAPNTNQEKTPFIKSIIWELVIAYSLFALFYCALEHCETGMEVIKEELWGTMCNKHSLYV